MAAALAALLTLAAPAAAEQGTRLLRETTLEVRGMICSSCTIAVERGVRKLDGVVEAKADLKNDLVRVRYDGNKVTPPQLAEAIRKAGYQARWPAERAPR